MIIEIRTEIRIRDSPTWEHLPYPNNLYVLTYVRYSYLDDLVSQSRKVGSLKRFLPVTHLI